MTIRGHVKNGVVVPDNSENLPEGAEVQIQVVESDPRPNQPRRGGIWKGRVKISEDFDELPDDLADALGMNEE